MPESESVWDFTSIGIATLTGLQIHHLYMADKTNGHIIAYRHHLLPNFLCNYLRSNQTVFLSDIICMPGDIDIEVGLLFDYIYQLHKCFGENISDKMMIHYLQGKFV